MKRLLLGLSVVTLVAGGQIVLGQGQGRGQQGPPDDPFQDRNDAGETIHVLPTPARAHFQGDTQARFAQHTGQPQVFPASYGNGNLSDHGGPEISSAKFKPVFWNAAVADSIESSGAVKIQQLIESFVSAFSSNGNYSQAATDDYAIIQQYGSSNAISPTLGQVATYVDTQASRGSIKDADIRNYLKATFGSSLDPSVLYGVYFPPGMKVLLQGGSCSSFCGYHSSFTYNNQVIKYAALPYLNCSACSLAGLTVGDMLTIVTSHEIREAVTDSQGSAWFDRSGYEADDKCAWHNLYQMTTGSFWVQPEYSNGGVKNGITYPGSGCVVPK